MGLNESDLKPVVTPLYGFTGNSIMPMSVIELMVNIGTYPRVSTVMTQFLVADCASAFNAVLERPILRELRVEISIYHLAMKFLTQQGVGKARGNQYDARTCYNNFLKLAAKDATPRTMMVQREVSGETSVEASGETLIKMTSEDFDPREIDGEVKTGPIENLEDFLFDRSSKILKIGARLQESMRASLVAFLESNLDVFAWQHSDIVMIDPNIICHRLNIDQTKKPRLSLKLSQSESAPENQSSSAAKMMFLCDGELSGNRGRAAWVASGTGGLRQRLG
ncbi:hypothetical protein PanWU01x14_079740 [Parasponia andersonii]|uniref:Uncharacterized protein n=1 Tax=Parasponia andersonii TaxID=3476 RepID=A0A2P5DBH6_PARAD|nr:hypothetical protein PanWU01x14_079740 [Parasponia andersonii]